MLTAQENGALLHLPRPPPDSQVADSSVGTGDAGAVSDPDKEFGSIRLHKWWDVDKEKVNQRISIMQSQAK
jgi:hypothetical protein